MILLCDCWNEKWPFSASLREMIWFLLLPDIAAISVVMATSSCSEQKADPLSCVLAGSVMKLAHSSNRFEEA